MGKQTPGRRIAQTPKSWNESDYPDNPDGNPWRPGDFWRNAWGEWEACTPNGAHVSLRGHRVTEHGDGTITVHPSIEANKDVPEHPYWHGYLTGGVWEEC